MSCVKELELMIPRTYKTLISLSNDGLLSKKLLSITLIKVTGDIKSIGYSGVISYKLQGPGSMCQRGAFRVQSVCRFIGEED